MSQPSRNELLKKRSDLQLRIRFDDFVKTYLAPFTEVLNELQPLQIHYRVASLRFAPQEFHPLFKEKFKTEDFAKYNLSDVDVFLNEDVIGPLMDIFPNHHSSRYFPDLPIVDLIEEPADVLTALIHTHQLEEKQAYIFWTDYACLLEIDLQGLATKANRHIFDNPYGDAVIFPKDYSWLIVYHAFEDEWIFGKQPQRL